MTDKLDVTEGGKNDFCCNFSRRTRDKGWFKSPETIFGIKKQKSKEDFLRFVTGIYGVDECVFDHIWEIPVIAPWDGNTLVKTSLSTKTKDELVKMIDGFIGSELGDEYGCFISLSKMRQKFTKAELNEWNEKLNNGELKLDYNAIIVYNEPKFYELYEMFMEQGKDFDEPLSQEDIDNAFVRDIKETITHERCHLNANCLVTEIKEMEEVQRRL